MYRLGLTKLALEVFHVYRKNNMLSLVNQMSLKYIMLCAAEAKDLRSLHMVYNSQSPSRQNSVILNCTLFSLSFFLPSDLHPLSSLSQRGQAGHFLAVPISKQSGLQTHQCLRGQRSLQQRHCRSGRLSSLIQVSTKDTSTRDASPHSTPSVRSLPLSPSPPNTK